jgi:hypothetical protein
MEDFYLGPLELNPDAPFPTVVFMGKRNSGKSTGMKVLAKMIDKYKVCVWSGNKETRNEWAKCLESRATVYGADKHGVAKLKEMVEYNQNKVDYYETVLHQPLPRKYNFLFIFDDVTATRAFRGAEFMEDLFSNGRHYYIAIIIATQHVRHLPPSVRYNADYIFLYHLNKRSLEQVHEELIEEPYDKQAFVDMVKQVTGKRDPRTGKRARYCLVFDNVGAHDKLSDQFSVFWAGRPEHFKNIKLGNRKWREWNKKNFIDVNKQAMIKQARMKEQKKRLASHYTPEFAHLRMEHDYYLEPEGEREGEGEEGNNNPFDTHHIQTKKSSFRIHLPRSLTHDEQTNTLSINHPQPSVYENQERPSYRESPSYREPPSYRERYENQERPSYRERYENRERYDNNERPSYREPPSYRERYDNNERPSYKERYRGHERQQHSSVRSYDISAMRERWM